MHRIQIEEASSLFNEEFQGRYKIVESISAGEDIICLVDNIDFISCIPVYYHGYYVRVKEIDKMRDFL